MKIKLLVTGSGGIGGYNFIKALRVSESLSGLEFYIIGTDYNPYHLLFPEVNVRVRAPRHSDPAFLPLIRSLAVKYGVDFLHPHPSVEARVVAENIKLFKELGIKVYLPEPEAIAPDKWFIYRKLKNAGVPVPETILIRRLEDIDEAFKRLGSPLWVRARTGAGGRLSLKVMNPEECKLWIKLNVIQGRAKVNDFIIQEYLPGRDVAFDSLWFNGELVTSYLRERLEYPFKHISLTGITGTPTVARIIRDRKAVDAGIRAVKALSRKPHGFFSVDIKYDSSGEPRVTEVDGKWHTTAPLWGMALSKVFNDLRYNLAYLYIALGLGLEIPANVEKVNAFPDDCYLIRQMDCGVILKCGDNAWRVT